MRATFEQHTLKYCVSRDFKTSPIAIRSTQCGEHRTSTSIYKHIKKADAHIKVYHWDMVCTRTSRIILCIRDIDQLPLLAYTFLCDAHTYLLCDMPPHENLVSSPSSYARTRQSLACLRFCAESPTEARKKLKYGLLKRVAANNRNRNVLHTGINVWWMSTGSGFSVCDWHTHHVARAHRSHTHAMVVGES